MQDPRFRRWQGAATDTLQPLPSIGTALGYNMRQTTRVPRQPAVTTAGFVSIASSLRLVTMLSMMP